MTHVHRVLAAWIIILAIAMMILDLFHLTVFAIGCAVGIICFSLMQLIYADDDDSDEPVPDTQPRDEHDESSASSEMEVSK